MPELHFRPFFTTQTSDY